MTTVRAQRVRAYALSAVWDAACRECEADSPRASILSRCDTRHAVRVTFPPRPCQVGRPVAALLAAITRSWPWHLAGNKLYEKEPKAAHATVRSISARKIHQLVHAKDRRQVEHTWTVRARMKKSFLDKNRRGGTETTQRTAKWTETVRCPLWNTRRRATCDSTVFIRTALSGGTCTMKGAPRLMQYVFPCSSQSEDAISTDSGETVTSNPALLTTLSFPSGQKDVVGGILQIRAPTPFRVRGEARTDAGRNPSPRQTSRVTLGATSAAQMSGERSLLLSRKTRTARNFQEIENAFKIACITHDTCTTSPIATLSKLTYPRGDTVFTNNVCCKPLWKINE